MPVMDGFEFCKKATKHFKDQNKFFDSKNECKITNYRPYIIACSAMVNRQIEEKATNCGFDLVLESPLQAAIVKNQIIPTVIKQKNRSQLSHKIGLKSLEHEELKINREEYILNKK